ncbi:MAG: hypothetical protein WB821_09720 [Burkholderiaceae bacterium]
MAHLQLTKRPYPFDYPFGPAKVVEFFRTYYGPTNRAFAALDPAGQAALHGDLELLWTQHNLATDGRTRYTAEYLEVVVRRACARRGNACLAVTDPDRSVRLRGVWHSRCHALPPP